MVGNGKVFVSHTHADNALCEPLLAALDAWRVDYWFDAQQLDAGQQLSPRLQAAITERDILLRVCTANTAQSYWMNLEQSAFSATQYQQRRNRRGSSPRLSIDLVLDATYRPGTAESANVVVSAFNKPLRVVLAELAAALGVKQREEPQGAISRRALLGLSAGGAVTVASLAGAGLLVKTRDDAAAAPYPTPKTIPFSNPQTLDKRIKWFFKAGDTQGAALALAGERLILSAVDGVYALNAADGSLLWWRPEIVGSATAGLAIVGETVYAASDSLTGELYALRLSDGSIIWKVAFASSFGNIGFALSQSQDALVMVTSDNSLIRYDTSNGAVVWTSTAKIVNSQSAFRAPISDDSNVYIGSDDGTFNAFNLADGSLRWSYLTGGAVGYTAAVANGVVCFGSQDQHLYALNTLDGAQLWRYAASDQVNYPPTISGTTVYCTLLANTQFQISALNISAGTLLWQAALDGNNDQAIPTGGLTVVGDALYAPAGPYLYAFSLTRRLPLWSLMTGPLDSNQTPPVVAGGTAYWSSSNTSIYALDTAPSA